MSEHVAAWMLESKQNPSFIVRQAPIYTAGPGEVLVQNHAVAINPADAVVQDYDPFNWTYPHTTGTDVAGIVVEVGHGVTHVKEGDRVLGRAAGLFSPRPQDGAFQTSTILHSVLCTPIPASLSYVRGCVLPTGLATAAHGLYGSDYLALTEPCIDGKPSGQTLLVWGGSSSVGSSVIQLARASGYEVYTTASAANAAYVNSLGASRAFDHRSPTIVADMVAALHGKTVVGAYDAISHGDTTAQCAEILVRSGGRKFVVSVLPTAPTELDGGVSAKPVLASRIKDNGIGEKIFVDFLEGALQQGVVKAKPDPRVVGKGLENIQEAVNEVRKGVSATKVVVEL